MRRAMNWPFPIHPSLLFLSVAVLLLGGPTVPDASVTPQQRESEITPNGLPVARTCCSSATEQSASWWPGLRALFWSEVNLQMNNTGKN